MGKRLWILFVLALASISASVSGEDTKADAQPPSVAGSDFKAIQEITVPKEYMVMPGMKVNGDGSLVLYVVQIAGDSLEYAVMANKTRLSDTMLELAKSQREKTGDTNISLDAADYRFTMVGDLVPSPLWQGVVYAAVTAKAGTVLLVNSLKPPSYAPLHCASGAFPSWFFAYGSGETVAYFARTGDKINLVADGMTELDSGALPISPAIIRGKRKAYVASSLGKCSLYVDGKKVGESHDAIEPVFYNKGKAVDSSVAYIAKDGDKSVLIIDGQVQTTGFLPGHDLVFAPGGDPYAYASADKGREFVVRNGSRVTKDKDFGQVRLLTFDSTKTKIAYVARDLNREWVMINDKKATPEYELISFCQEQFRINGELFFAGLDGAKNIIVVGQVKSPSQ